ncbi:MAG: N-acetylmuramoyl-L-alanine amidase, partial [Rhodocyclaceae bacterium]|nr:N-acetylmuramoyl-L-alanine amidase [Rhodocyclaceae bacterium]
LAVHWYDNLVVLYRTALPAVLFEAGVIKHRDEELELRDAARQQRMADGIATGVAACLQVMRSGRGTTAQQRQ